MSRKLRALTTDDLKRLPSGCACCAFWETAERMPRACAHTCDEEKVTEWYRRVIDEWGECGRVAYEDDEILGFVKYAPSGYFPQAFTFPAPPADPKVPLIACLHISPEARHHGLGTVMLRAALSDLTKRGERRVEAFATVEKPTALDETPLLGIDFLLRNGFTVSRPHPQYPLLKLDLRSLAVITENLETVLQSLRLPLRAPRREPATWMKGR